MGYGIFIIFLFWLYLIGYIEDNIEGDEHQHTYY